MFNWLGQSSGNDSTRGSDYLKHESKTGRWWVRAVAANGLLDQLLTYEVRFRDTPSGVLLLNKKRGWIEQVKGRSFFTCKIQRIVEHADGLVSCWLLDGVNSIRAVFPPRVVDALRNSEEKPLELSEIQNALIEVNFTSISWKPLAGSFWKQFDGSKCNTCDGIVEAVIDEFNELLTVQETGAMEQVRPVELEKDISEICQHIKKWFDVKNADEQVGPPVALETTKHQPAVMRTGAVSAQREEGECSSLSDPQTGPASVPRKRAFVPTGCTEKAPAPFKRLNIRCHRRRSQEPANEPNEASPDSPSTDIPEDARQPDQVQLPVSQWGMAMGNTTKQGSGTDVIVDLPSNIGKVADIPPPPSPNDITLDATGCNERLKDLHEPITITPSEPPHCSPSDPGRAHRGSQKVVHGQFGEKCLPSDYGKPDTAPHIQAEMSSPSHPRREKKSAATPQQHTIKTRQRTGDRGNGNSSGSSGRIKKSRAVSPRSTHASIRTKLIEALRNSK